MQDLSRWPRAERAAFDRLALLVALIPDLADWPARDRRALVSLMRAKGGMRERTYVERQQRHERLRAALDRIAEDDVVHS